MPGDPAVIEHIDAVRMREGEGDILLRQQKGERGRLPQPLDRLGELAERSAGASPASFAMRVRGPSGYGNE